MLAASSCEIASGGGFKNVKIKLSVGDHKWGRWGKKSGNFGITLSTYSHDPSTHATFPSKMRASSFVNLTNLNRDFY